MGVYVCNKCRQVLRRSTRAIQAHRCPVRQSVVGEGVSQSVFLTTGERNFRRTSHDEQGCPRGFHFYTFSGVVISEQLAAGFARGNRTGLTLHGGLYSLTWVLQGFHGA